MSYLNDTDYQEGEDDVSGDPTMEEEGDHDGSGDPTEKGALTVSKSGEVYILIKPLLTRCINCFVCTYIDASFFF